MTRALILALACLMPIASAAQTSPGTTAIAFAPVTQAEVRLEDFLWLKRPVVVFAQTPADPAFIEQMRLLEAFWSELEDRDVVVITDTDPGANSAIREKLRPRGFMLVLIGKDGQIVLRKPTPWDVRELSRTIDKLPLRREEIRNRRN
ncbi:MAG: DUF4174 domain-containing protein [Rhodobacteraceae bacterium]|nr:DUF4174 domain-containing protein [Paracoccaceae bacterium]MCP5341824.1 DUF4174 domain-containing protein [Paracoccaceae bacterium]